MNQDKIRNRLLEIRKELTDIKASMSQVDPLLIEISRQICSAGACLAEGSKPLPKGKCKLVKDYYHCKIEPKEHFDPHSFRAITPKEGVKVIIGCPKGEWDSKIKRCKVGTSAQKILYHKDVFEHESSDK